jgi:hypothetical protein
LKPRRSLPLLAACAALVACANDAALRSALDQDGRTWVTAATLVTLARPAPRFSHAARDYLYVAPVETNHMGARSRYLWVGFGSTVDRASTAPATAANLVLTVDGVPFVLQLDSWDDPRAARAYETAAPLHAVRRARVTLDQLERLAAAASIQTEAVSADGAVARYDLWDGTWSQLQTFVLGLDAERAARARTAL